MSDDMATVRRMNAAGSKDAAIARVIGCSAAWVSQLRKRMGIPRTKCIRGARWNAAESAVMTELVDLQRRLRERVREVAEQLGRTVRSVQEKLKELTTPEE